MFAKYFPDLKIKEYYLCQRGIRYYSQVLTRFFFVDRICKRLDVFESDYNNMELYEYLAAINFANEEFMNNE